MSQDQFTEHPHHQGATHDERAPAQHEAPSKGERVTETARRAIASFIDGVDYTEEP